MTNLFQRIFHVGDPFWARLGTPIGGSENNPYPDRWGSRDLSNGTKVAIGVGIIVTGTVVGGPIGGGIAIGCVATGIIAVGVVNSHFRQRRLDNLQSFAGNINAKARSLSQKHDVDAHDNEHQNCGHHHSHNHHSHIVNEGPKGHDNCSDKVTHGLIHPIKDKKWDFLAIFVARQCTNFLSVVKVALSIISTIVDFLKETLSPLLAPIGVVSDTATTLVDGARAGLYAYRTYNEEYKRYTDVVKKRDNKLPSNDTYYSSQQAFSLLKDFIITKDCNKLSTTIKNAIEESDNIEDFLKKATEGPKLGKKTSPITAIAFVMDNFTLITESKKQSIPEGKTKEFLEESYSHFKIKERWGPRQGMLPYRNDVVYHLSDDGKKEEISLRSWQVKQQLSFDQKKIESLLSQQNNDKFTELGVKIDNIIDSDLKKRKLGRVQYQNIYNILMIESLEPRDLDFAIQTIDNLSASLDGKKLLPSVIREKLSKNTYGQPHQELDGYAQKPAKLLGSLNHNITYSELCEALSSEVKDKIPRPPVLDDSNAEYKRARENKTNRMENKEIMKVVETAPSDKRTQIGRENANKRKGELPVTNDKPNEIETETLQNTVVGRTSDKPSTIRGVQPSPIIDSVEVISTGFCGRCC
jgi:hypothetical protein